MAVPKAMQEKYNEIAAILEPYCDEYLNDEYKELCLHALEKLCRKRPSPLISGKATTWAAGIIYAIGQNNFIFDKSQPIHMTAEVRLYNEELGLSPLQIMRKIMDRFDLSEDDAKSYVEDTLGVKLELEMV